MDIIIPIYNLSDSRIANLKFILEELTKQEITNVYVCEQYHEDSDITPILEDFKLIKHKVYDIKSECFNKSKLINKSVSDCKSSLIWLLDGDVYLNYRYVIQNIPNDIDFARPFVRMVLLNEEETNNVRDNGKLNLSDRDYDSYEGYGKYSMIFSKKLFNNLDGFNENYEGWGFQDLDFVKRIPNHTKKGHTDNIGFHLFHDKQKLDHYNNNKNIFVDIEKRAISKKANTEYVYEQDIKKEEQYYEIPSVSVIVDEKKSNIQEPILPKVNPTLDKIQHIDKSWDRPTHIFICKLYNGQSLSNKIKDWTNVILKDLSKPVSISRTLRGTVRKKYNKNGSGYFFIKFIIDNYEDINKKSTIVYVNDIKDKEKAIQVYDYLKLMNRRKFEKNKELGFAYLEDKIGFLVSGELISRYKITKFQNMFDNIKKLPKSEQNQYVNDLLNFLLESFD